MGEACARSEPVLRGLLGIVVSPLITVAADGSRSDSATIIGATNRESHERPQHTCVQQENRRKQAFLSRPAWRPDRLLPCSVHHQIVSATFSTHSRGGRKTA
jgi:hypothetical protein